MADDDSRAASTPGDARRTLSDLLNGVAGVESEAKQEIASARAQLRDATEALREAVAKLHPTEDDAWHRYGAEVDSALGQMDEDLSSAETQLRIEEAESRDQLSYALQQAAETWRARAEEVRLQISLGQMQARDAGLHALDDLDRAGHNLVTMIEELRRDTAASVSTLRERTRSVVSELQSGLREVAQAFRAEWPKQD